MCLIGLELFVAIISLFSVCLSPCLSCTYTCSFLSAVCLSYGFHVLTTFVVNKRIYITDPSRPAFYGSLKVVGTDTNRSATSCNFFRLVIHGSLSYTVFEINGDVGQNLPRSSQSHVLNVPVEGSLGILYNDGGLQNSRMMPLLERHKALKMHVSTW